jgi:hypothetical protein
MKVKGMGHKLHMDNFFSSPDIYDNLHTRVINYCGTARQNHKGIPRGLDKKTLKLKQGTGYRLTCT